MKTALSIVLLLAGLSVGAVGVGYALRRQGAGQGSAGSPAATTPLPAPTPVPPATIAIGEPAPGYVLAGTQAGGTTIVGGSGQLWAGGSPTFDERGPIYTQPVTQPVLASNSALLEQLRLAALAAATSGVTLPGVQPAPVHTEVQWQDILTAPRSVFSSPITQPVTQPLIA